MHEFIATIRLPRELTEDFVRRIPQQRTLINQLMRRNIITAYSLSADRRMLWVVVRANDSEEARRVIQSFPLYEFMNETITELMFHEQTATLVPELSLN